MKWKPLEDVKRALLECLAKLQAEDVFNIIAFNEEILEFSTSMEFATDETISAVTEWLDSNLIANGGTNMLLPLTQVFVYRISYLFSRHKSRLFRLFSSCVLFRQ